jgi:hypothetical protein
MLYIYIGSGGAGGLIIFIILICCCCKDDKPKINTTTVHPENDNGETEMTKQSSVNPYND